MCFEGDFVNAIGRAKALLPSPEMAAMRAVEQAALDIIEDIDQGTTAEEIRAKLADCWLPAGKPGTGEGL